MITKCTLKNSLQIIIAVVSFLIIFTSIFTTTRVFIIPYKDVTVAHCNQTIFSNAQCKTSIYVNDKLVTVCNFCYTVNPEICYFTEPASSCNFSYTDPNQFSLTFVVFVCLLISLAFSFLSCIFMFILFFYLEHIGKKDMLDDYIFSI